MELKTSILVIGGGTGGIAAGLIAASLGHDVILTEETPWLGGQLTSQLVPPDESLWVENHGGTARYREYRRLVRQYYHEHYPLTDEAKSNPLLDPGDCRVSPLGHEPTVGTKVLDAMSAPLRASDKFKVLHGYRPHSVSVDGDRITAVKLIGESKEDVVIHADYVLDATELGDLLPMSGTEFVVGAEAQSETGEPHALPQADPRQVQAFTWCVAVSYDRTPGANHISPRPARYDHFRNWRYESLTSLRGPRMSFQNPAPPNVTNFVLLPEEFIAGKNGPFPLWEYRRVLCARHFPPDKAPEEITLINWPQIDYLEGNLLEGDESNRNYHLEEARQLTLSLVHWLQTETPRPDGGVGYPGLRLRPDAAGSADGLALAPYIRESRRIRARFTVTENHVGVFARTGFGGDHVAITPEQRRQILDRKICAEQFADSVGTGFYGIDIHYHAGGAHGLSLEVFPYQIPLGSLIPVRLRNLLPACKNLGVTHLTNGCYRLHPTEWNIGEAAGALASFCLSRHTEPHQVHEQSTLREEYQQLLQNEGFDLEWPEKLEPLHDPGFLKFMRETGRPIDRPRYYC